MPVGTGRWEALRLRFPGGDEGDMMMEMGGDEDGKIVSCPEAIPRSDPVRGPRNFLLARSGGAWHDILSALEQGLLTYFGGYTCSLSRLVILQPVS
jgi:hypothetical protein